MNFEYRHSEGYIRELESRLAAYDYILGKQLVLRMDRDPRSRTYNIGVMARQEDLITEEHIDGELIRLRFAGAILQEGKRVSLETLLQMAPPQVSTLLKNIGYELSRSIAKLLIEQLLSNPPTIIGYPEGLFSW